MRQAAADATAVVVGGINALAAVLVFCYFMMALPALTGPMDDGMIGVAIVAWATFFIEIVLGLVTMMAAGAVERRASYESSMFRKVASLVNYGLAAVFVAWAFWK